MNWKLLLVLGVTAACLAWVLQGLDVGEVRGAAAGFAWWVFAPMAGFYLLAHLVRVWRLGTLLHAPVPFRRLLSVNTIGFLAINVMPLRLGELVRPYLLWDRDRIGLARSLPAILVERLLDFGMLLAMLLLAGSLPLVQEPRAVFGMDVLATGQRTAGAVVGLGVVACAALVALGDGRFTDARARWGRVAGGRVGRTITFAETSRRVLADLARSPLRAATLVVQSAVIWGLTVLGLWTAMQGSGLPGLDPAAALVTWSVTLSAMTVLPTPGFVGAYEAACAGTLQLLGVAPAQALVLAVVLHAGQLGFTVVLGTTFLLAEGASLLDLVRKSRRLAGDGTSREPVEAE